MRKSFMRTLKVLNEEISKMAMLASKALAQAMQALDARDLAIAKQVEEDDEAVDQLQLVIDKHCLEALIRQQPLAKDMRLVLATLKMTGELERIGDQAADIAHLVERIIMREYQHYRIDTLRKMYDIAVQMLATLQHLFSHQSEELSDQIDRLDDQMDELYRQARQELKAIMRENAQYVDEGVTYLSIAKYFEKIGDHITNASEWIEYVRTGRFAKERRALDDHLEE
ncbi:phosphate signaling complex protein PhoU [Entomospira culicis]|uniref:Phosphate-specific transport system accessory protein PhoU n=1 Tax=Entomospira culicis TaxID=2719989 RepID=A0A968GK67_9SPIO|nr:phosphate signaling complex protein PhoU [Entomospira culicis]NIZ19141.1 phosphate signaling complex protein PhoU [Entomospira culicis]NIZ69355.1 phosphate signaling complex protein PhoU [Entomospira culicis]WDI37940.1 phosphate signaling complex protein PhoU [Entomospira culicis]WDI39568.1 phosphate signaling complex protein PhoU [Entomospira culicis]